MSLQDNRSTNDLYQQQQGGMSAPDFAELHGLSKQQLAKLLNAGKVLGASRHPLSKHWWIYPPATLLERPRPYVKRTGQPGLPTDTAARSSDPTEAQAGARRGASSAMGIPEGGRSPALPVAHLETSPFSASRVSPGKLPDVFASRQTKEAVHAVKLATSQTYYPVVLSGAQMLVIERALLHDAEALKRRLDFVDEFEPEARSATGEQLGTVYAALRVIKQAATAKNRERESFGQSLKEVVR